VARSQLVDDRLWELVKPLLVDRSPQQTGRHRVSDRTAFTAIVFVLVSGVPWRMVPRQIGCSWVTVWRRPREWQRAGVWERLHRELLRHLNAEGYIHVLSSNSGHRSLGPL
jgi:transposase